MRLRMKNLKCFWCSLKNWALRGGFHKKPIQRGGGLSKNGGAWTVCKFKGGVWQERGGCF